MDYKELKKKECLFEIINDFADSMDIYRHNGSLWLINTEETKWMIEFTEDKTLWYNYRIFSSLFRGISLDLTENQKYVTEWFESRFLNLHTVKTTEDPFFDQDKYVEDTIQNGVKDTFRGDGVWGFDVEDTIQNGVKDTMETNCRNLSLVEDTIENGVKHTQKIDWEIKKSLFEGINQNGVKVLRHERGIRPLSVRDTIQNGVKHTDCYDGRRSTKVEDTIQNGVSETKRGLLPRTKKTENTIQNGVKHTKKITITMPWLVEETIQNGVKVTNGTLRRTLLGVDDIIQKGVKEIQPLPAQDGNRDWGKYSHGKEDRTKPHDQYVYDAIQNGVKETHEDPYPHTDRIKGIIKVGKKID